MLSYVNDLYIHYKQFVKSCPVNSMVLLRENTIGCKLAASEFHGPYPKPSHSNVARMPKKCLVVPVTDIVQLKHTNTVLT